MAHLVQSTVGVTRLVLFAFVLGAAGCLDWEDDQVQFGEDFEGCGGCTWVPSGDFTIVTTNHPGEHAARLGAGATISHALTIERFVDLDDGYNEEFSDGNWLEYSTDCQGRPGLALEPNAGAIGIRLRLEAPSGDPFTRRKLMLPAIPPEAVPAEDLDPDDYEGVSVIFNQLAIESAAPCRLDNVRLMISGGTVAY